MASLTDEIRAFWNDDAAVYDDALGHAPRSATELAAWRGAIHELLPPAPARVLDVGAGTGFLSLLLAGLGYEVTALDLAPAMLAQLAHKADAAGLKLTTLEGDATSPPREDFDAVVQRHLLWTLPDPSAALEAWREAAPAGRLVLFETNYGDALPASLEASGLPRRTSWPSKPRKLRNVKPQLKPGKRRRRRQKSKQSNT